MQRESWKDTFYAKFTERKEVHRADLDTNIIIHSWDARIRPEDVADFVRQARIDAVAEAFEAIRLPAPEDNPEVLYAELERLKQDYLKKMSL